MSSRRLEDAHRIWLGAAGTATAFGLLRSLREAWGDSIYVIAADINPPDRVAAALFADAYEQVPESGDDAFGCHLVDALVDRRVDTYAPILDEEIVLAARMVEHGAVPPGVMVVAPPLHAAERCWDKLAMSQWLTAHGLPTPRTMPVEEALWTEPGMVLKPRYGRGSVGVVVIGREAELRMPRPNTESLLAQELCAGPECTLDVFVSRDRQFCRVLCRERLESKSGVCTKARIFENEQLSRLAVSLGLELGIGGTFCLQVMRGREAEWVITDVNPRPGGGTRMSAAAGVDFLAAGLADLWGLDARPYLPSLTAERIVVRQYEEYVL